MIRYSHCISKYSDRHFSPMVPEFSNSGKSDIVNEHSEPDPKVIFMKHFSNFSISAPPSSSNASILKVEATRDQH